MSVRANRIALILTYLTLVVVCMASPTPAAEPGSVDASLQNRKLGRGVNIIGYDIDKDQWVRPIHEALIPREP